MHVLCSWRYSKEWGVEDLTLKKFFLFAIIVDNTILYKVSGIEYGNYLYTFYIKKQTNTKKQSVLMFSNFRPWTYWCLILQSAAIQLKYFSKGLFLPTSSRKSSSVLNYFFSLHFVIFKVSCVRICSLLIKVKTAVWFVFLERDWGNTLTF